MESRKDQYKHQPESMDSQRSKRRENQLALRKEKREQVLSGKRVRVDENELEEDDLSVDEVIAATKKLSVKSSDKQSLLKLLRQAFSQGTALVDAFLSVDNSMACLVGLLTGLDAEVQLEAAWCLTNIAAGTDGHAAIVIKHAGPYLVTYLSSGNTPLQDQCAWALGNLAGGSVECRDTLRSQGALCPLVNLLQSPVFTVVQSSAFALSNFARDRQTQSELVAGGILPHLAAHLNTPCSPDRLPVMSEVAWVLTYLAATGDHTVAILSAGLLPRLTSLIVEVSQADVDNFHVLTPLLRSLGNLACGVSGEAVTQLFEDRRLVPALGRLLQTQHHHMRKETLWVLSNVSVFPIAANELLAAEVLPTIIQLLSSPVDIRNEAAYCLCNIATQGAPALCAALLDGGALEALPSLLKLSDPDSARMGLSLLEMLLTAQPEATSRFEACGGLDCLEALEYCSNEVLCSLTSQILESFFYKDDS